MIEYWIQKSDYSSQEWKTSSINDVIKVFKEFDWESELNSFAEEDDSNNCPPGLGVMFNGALLHICPNDKDHVFFNFHYKALKKRLWLFPYLKNETHYVSNYGASMVEHLIKLHMAGDIQGICAIR